MYLDVVIRHKSRAVDQLFTYKADDRLSKYIDIGHRISVPFGNSNKPIEAIVVRKKKNITGDIDESKLKYIYDVLDEFPIISEENIKLAFWIRNRYMSTYSDSINLFYPKGYRINVTRKVSLTDKNISRDSLTSKENELMEILEKNDGPVSYEDIAENYSYALIMSLKSRGIISVQWEYKNRKNIKILKYIRLSDDADERLENEKKQGPKQKEIIKFLRLNREVELGDLRNILKITSSTVNSLEKKGIIVIEESEFYRDASRGLDIADKEVSLNEQQQQVLDRIISGAESGEQRPFLLHGVTGSGKTEVYLKLIEYMLKQSLDSVFLVPEIALTPMMISRVKNRFGNVVGVFHSSLSEGEKQDVYREIGKGNIRVVIGTRSALFLPYMALGLVIVDEEHDMSYRSEMNPKYDSIEIARYMALKMGVTAVLGSATPSISDYYRAENGEYILLEMNERANKRPLPKIETVDMRNCFDSDGRPADISERLFSEIEDTVSDGNQVILFINRRGYSNFISCKSCGYVFRCDHCDISLTYHKSANRGICHYCGMEKPIPAKCPQCGSEHLGTTGVGTEKIEAILRKRYPDFRVSRVDRDTVSGKGRLEKILDDFNSHKADILVGTQILAKGHDFENVTLVGIISADMMLNYPDFRAFETTFQLISQVSGRAGRGEKEGKVILQTYNTDHFAIRDSVNHDYRNFYEKEIKLRKSFGYEPFNNILRVVFSGKNYSVVEENSYRFSKSLEYLLSTETDSFDNMILGPGQCAVNRINGNYRWQVVIKDEKIGIKTLKSMVKYLCITKHKEIFSDSVSISIELNPNTFI